MKIVVVSTFYTEGMGYAENCLPKALSALGHEVHLITSNLNVYGNEKLYEKSYKSFLGPADQGIGSFEVDGYTVHRLPSKLVFSYVFIKNLYRNIKKLSPDIVHSTEVAAIHTFIIAILKPFFKFKLFTETHQHLSVIKPYLKNKRGHFAKRLIYKITRTWPTYFASLAIEKCYAISPDCAEVANVYFGVPMQKIKLQSLGTDTDLFCPANSNSEIIQRNKLRKDLGYNENDIVCIYTGRFSNDKNPLILANAINYLASQNKAYFGLFIGDGIQKDSILKCNNTRIIPFIKHKELADYYRIADVAVWPTQESMSMLDAASSGLPIIVSDKMGEFERINGNGKTYSESDYIDLSRTLESYSILNDRIAHGSIGREKMIQKFSWTNIANDIVTDYIKSN